MVQESGDHHLGCDRNPVINGVFNFCSLNWWVDPGSLVAINSITFFVTFWAGMRPGTPGMCRSLHLHLGQDGRDTMIQPTICLDMLEHIIYEYDCGLWILNKHWSVRETRTCACGLFLIKKRANVVQVCQCLTARMSKQMNEINAWMNG